MLYLTVQVNYTDYRSVVLLLFIIVFDAVSDSPGKLHRSTQ